jgi:D-lactate dehydrogenase
MRIVAFEAEEWEQCIFDRFRDEHEVTCTSEPLSMDNAEDYSDTEVISTFIHSKLPAEVIRKLKKAKLIATRSTGYDHIDMEQCRAQKIIVCNVPGYGENTVAEHVFGLLLCISHKLVQAIDRTRRGDFSQSGLQGFDLEEKTIGVVGTGDIGRHVVRIAGGFNMKVCAFDISPDKELAERQEFEYVEMDELLSRSDVITLHVPANEKTRHLLSDDEFSKMKDGVVIINTSRGSVIDVSAMMRAIADGKVRAAGLDVLAEEPVVGEEAELLRTAFHKKHNLEQLLADHVLLRLRNVVVTPHSAFNTREAVQRILDTTADNVASFLQGRPQHVVTQE